ncbi:MAG: hypothetical protein WCO98_08850 [bacterium]
MRLIFQILLISILLTFTVSQVQSTEVPLEKVPCIEGNYLKPVSDVTVNAVPQKNVYYLITTNDKTSYSLNKKYDWFICDAAIRDDAPEGKEGYDNPLQYKVLPDGNDTSLAQLKLFENPKPIKISVKNMMRISFFYQKVYYANTPQKIVLINPRFVTADVDTKNTTETDTNTKPVISPEISAKLMDFIILMRKNALQQKNTAWADYVVSYLDKIGIVLVDLPDGTTTYKLK